MAKKKTLDEVYFTPESGSLIGISNHLKDYQIAYYINKILNIELEREKDFYYFNAKKEKKKIHNNSLLYSDLEDNNSEDNFLYSIYTYVDEGNHLMYILLNTRSEGVILHEAFKTFDKLLFIFGRDHKEAAQNLHKLQKGIPNTLLINLFDFSPIIEGSIKGGKTLTAQNKKSLQKIYDFLNNELLPEIEMYFIETVSEKDRNENIIF